MKSAPQPAGSPPRPKLKGDARVAVLFGAIAVLYFAREILIPFAFALILTFLLTPVVAFLQRLRAGRIASVLATLVFSIALATGIGWIIAGQLVEVANQLPLYRQNIQAKIQAFHLPVTGELGHAVESVQEVFRELSSPEHSRRPSRRKASESKAAGRAARPGASRVRTSGGSPDQRVEGTS